MLHTKCAWLFFVIEKSYIPLGMFHTLFVSVCLRGFHPEIECLLTVGRYVVRKICALTFAFPYDFPSEKIIR